jgi:hypothetical protein
VILARPAVEDLFERRKILAAKSHKGGPQTAKNLWDAAADSAMLFGFFTLS